LEELELFNANLRKNGQPEVTVLPNDTYVSYRNVSKEEVEAQFHIKNVLAQAEEVRIKINIEST
jgi:hypothetical protein